MFRILLLLFSISVSAQDAYNTDGYVFENSQDLVNLYSAAGTVNLNSSDDGWSGNANFGFTFSRWGNDYTSARMSTNGCVNLYGSTKCNDYTPQALPYRNHTLYPFWTDMIRGTSSSGHQSKMLFKAFDDYVVFGWYYMREYQRSSSNSFEAILYANDSYEFRYRELDIVQHDVLIGEQGDSNETKTYLFYDDGKNFATFDAFDASHDNPIEGGGSLYTGTVSEMCGINALYSTECTGYEDAVLAASCASNALNNASCPGYAAAFLTQQCSSDALYSESCSGFAAAYFTQQCSLDPLYDSSCEGHASAYAYEQEVMMGDSHMVDGFNDSYDGQDFGANGYDPRDDQSLEYDNLSAEQQMLVDQGLSPQDAVLITMGEDDIAALGLDPSIQFNGEHNYGELIHDEYSDLAQTELFVTTVEDYEHNDDLFFYGEGYVDFTMEDWYEIDVEEFGQEQVDEWYGDDVQFDETGTVIGEMAFYEDPIQLETEEIFEELEDLDELYEDEYLEDFEREALEEIEEEIFEEFIQEAGEERIEDLIDDEAFDDLIQEEELEELLEPEELFDEIEIEEEIEEVMQIEREEVLIAEEREASAPATANKSSGVSRALATLRLAGGNRETASIIQQQITDRNSGGGSGSNSSGSSSSFSTASNSEQQQIIQSSGDTAALEQQVEQTGTLNIDAGNTNFGSVSVSAFESSDDQQGNTEQQEFAFGDSSSGSFGGSDTTFENKFDDALSTGQSIGQFLSQEAPNFSRFDIAPPTAQEQRTTSAVESLADRLGDQAAQENLQEQLESMDASGGFNDQSIAVAYIGYKPGFSAYTNQNQLEDQDTWYQDKEMYKGTQIEDNKFGFYMMAGKTELKIKEMIKSQYE